MTAVLVILLGALPGCGVRGLDFLQDNRVTITAPSDRAKVSFPVTFEWTVKDFKITGENGNRRQDAGYFGVYVDRSPQPPEKNQEWFFKDDRLCPRKPGCPGKEFRALQNIHSTTETRFTIESLPEPRTGSAQPRREFHELTIALLNGKGERIGESAFTVQFEINRAN